MKVFMLSHLRSDEDDSDLKICGIFSSEEQAHIAINEYITKPGFKDYPNGFDVGPFIINKLYWDEGFGFNFSEQDFANNDD